MTSAANSAMNSVGSRRLRSATHHCNRIPMDPPNQLSKESRSAHLDLPVLSAAAQDGRGQGKSTRRCVPWDHTRTINPRNSSCPCPQSAHITHSSQKIQAVVAPANRALPRRMESRLTNHRHSGQWHERDQQQGVWLKPDAVSGTWKASSATKYNETTQKQRSKRTNESQTGEPRAGLCGSDGPRCADGSSAVEHTASADRSQLGSPTANGILATA